MCLGPYPPHVRFEKRQPDPILGVDTTCGRRLDAPCLRVQMGEDQMNREQKANCDPAAHQPSKAELEEDVGIDATPESLAWAVTRGGAEPRDRKPRS